MGLRHVGAVRVLMRGIGDIAAAVARRLFIAGHPVVVHDGVLRGLTHGVSG